MLFFPLLFKNRLWKICFESSITMLSQGVSASGSAHRPCYHRRHRWPTKVRSCSHIFLSLQIIYLLLVIFTPKKEKKKGKKRRRKNLHSQDSELDNGVWRKKGERRKKEKRWWAINERKGKLANCRGPSSSQRTLMGEQQQQQSIGGEGVMDPDSLAQTYWHLHVQDRTAWTQEIDLRPSNSIPGFC